MAGYDSLGACIFAAFGYSVDKSVIPGLLNAIYGWDLGETALQDLGRESLVHEREFNRRAGFTKKDDRLPEWVTKEALAPHNAVFDVPEEDLDSVFDW
jgi:aldehyde:ferredoxin oxidoreductase